MSAGVSVDPAPTSKTWVDFYYPGPEFGTNCQPYSTLTEAVSESSWGETIIIKASTSPETLVIDSEATLRSFGGSARIGQ